MSQSVKPTVGRVVQVFYPDWGAVAPALICKVIDHHTINVGGFDPEGRPFSQAGLPLLADDSPRPDKQPHALWPSHPSLRAELPFVHAPLPVADEAAFEKSLQARGLTAPRLTPEQIDAAIVSAAYHVFPGTTLTVCCLTLRNGFRVIGENSPVSADNFKADIGQALAYKRAREKAWELEGYLLRERLMRSSADDALSEEGKALVAAGGTLDARAGLPSAAIE